MKRKLIYLTMMLAGAFALVACSDDGNEFPWDDTESSAVVLESFGPCPMIRGGELRFIGKNLDKVTEIVLPDELKITDIKKKSSTEISIVVPQEAEVGYVKLVYPKGTITTKTMIAYTEAFTITSVSPLDTPVRYGDNITIEGDYLNNIVNVAFMDDAVVGEEDFVSRSRYKLVVPVPRNAKSGKIQILDADDLNVYSNDEIEVLQPVAGAASPAAVKAGELLTIDGTDMDLVESVVFAGGATVAVEDFESVSEGAVVVAVPADAQDGAVAVVSYAGESSTAENEIVLAVPTGLKVEAESRFKAGLGVTITGNDLDLVTALAFAEGVDTEFVYADGKIAATIPATAVNGALTLTLSSTKTVETEPIELVVPTVDNCAATVLAGDTFAVSGADLDLVTGVTVAGVKHDFTASETQIVVTTTATTQSGAVVLTLANGTKVTAAESIEVTYDSMIVITSMPSSASVGESITITGSNFNMIEAIYFGSTKVVSYSKRGDDEMTFIIPAETPTGIYNLTMVLTTGDTEYSPQTIDVRGAVTTVVIWEGECSFGGWARYQEIDGSALARIPAGATMVVEYKDAVADSWPQLSVKSKADGWPMLPCFPGNEWGVVEMDAAANSYSFVVDYESLLAAYTYGMVLAGQNMTVTRAYFTFENGDTDPVYISDIVLVDYEAHGGHDGSWDGSWSGTASVVTENGNSYIRSTVDSSSETWIVNCNHQSDIGFDADYYKVAAAENYVLKFDIKIENGVSGASAATMQAVLGDGWNWYGEGFFPESTDGKWKTVSIPLTYWGKSGALDCSSGTNGMYGGNIPAGICIDNMRLSLAE